MNSRITDQAVLEEAERILASQSLSNSDALRRLLLYLTEKSLSDEAHRLREYTVGIDVFGKEADYNPRKDSGVRIQVGRLRLKLAEYYQSEGINDPIVMTLPKGGFKLLFEERGPVTSGSDALQRPVESEIKNTNYRFWRSAVYVLAAALPVALLWASWSSISLRRHRENHPPDPVWTPAVQELWSPFTDATRPLLIVLRTPNYVGLRGKGVYRIQPQWDQLSPDPNIKLLRRALSDPEIFPVHSYTGFGEAKAAAELGMLLGHRTQNIHLARSSDVSWQQISDSNVIFLGTSVSFAELLHSLPVKTHIALEKGGVRISADGIKPASFVQDKMTGLSALGYSFQPDDGVVNAVIGILPGPNDNGVVGTFMASTNAGILAAVEYATDPATLPQLIEKLKGPSGRVPRYFEAAVQVTFKGGAKTDIRYLTHDDLQVDANATGKQ